MLNRYGIAIAIIETVFRKHSSSYNANGLIIYKAFFKYKWAREVFVSNVLKADIHEGLMIEYLEDNGVEVRVPVVRKATVKIK